MHECGFWRTLDANNPNFRFSEPFYVWTKSGPPPYFIRDPNNRAYTICYYIPTSADILIEDRCVASRALPGFAKVFDIVADLSLFRGKLKKRRWSKGEYLRLDLKIKIEFGGTEVKAWVSCKGEVSATSQYS